MNQSSAEEQERLQRRSQYLVRRLLWFWPIVTNVDDVERVTLYGYWLAIAMAVLNGVQIAMLLLRGSSREDLLWGVALTVVSCLFYFIGANAVRLRSFGAATLLTVETGALMLYGRVLHGSFDLQTPLEFVLFLIMLRGIFLAARFVALKEDAMPLRLTAGMGRAPIDQWPRRIWPRMQPLFYLCGALLMLFQVITGFLAVR